MRVEATIVGVNQNDIFCNSGAQQGPFCTKTVVGGNAGVSVGAQAYGLFSGSSNHGLNSGWFDYQKLTTLDARTYADQCADQGPEYSWNGSECVYSPGSPIVIATHWMARYRFTSLEDGVLFDINGDGVLERIAWTEPGSSVAFLALDRDGDGQITSGKELFGNHTLPGSPNGFDALLRTAMESNGGIMRGSVSSDDPVYHRLLLWTDRNHNGISEANELRLASELVSDIGLGYFVSDRQDRFGNLYLYRGWASLRTAPGRNRIAGRFDDDERRLTIWDVYFKMAQ